MPLNHIPQPEILPIHDSLRLKRYDGNYKAFLTAYQTPYIYQNSEGIWDEDKIPDLDYVKGMCQYLDTHGELYYIEALENGSFLPIGDVTVKAENPPIAIWLERYRGVGVGTLVMQTVIRRLKELGVRQITGSTDYKGNMPSQRLHEKLGFRRVGETETDFIYDLKINEIS